MKNDLNIDGVPIIRLENISLKVDVAPSIGGRIINIQNKSLNYQILWHNPDLKLKKNPVGSEYDSNFFGGIDDILPNDISEKINGITYPDHGEVWTMEFDYKIKGKKLILYGYLPLVGFYFEKIISLRVDSPHIDIYYQIKNPSQSSRYFLWRLHTALKIQAGDKILCLANKAKVVDKEWSRFGSIGGFSWPVAGEYSADIIPEKDGSSEFLFIEGLSDGRVGWERTSENLRFEVFFDKEIFPVVCYFASFGKLNNCYTAVIEPSTTNTVSVKEVIESGGGICA